MARNSSQGGKKYPKPVWFEDHEMREEARIFLDEFWPEGTTPVDIEQIADVRASLDIVPMPGIFRAYEIDGFLSNDMTSIFVDEGIAGGATLHRYRFTLAHELGHWYLHERLYEAARFADVRDFVRFRDELPAKDRANYEWQASQFAGLILVPPDVLRETLERALDRARDAGIGRIDLANYALMDYVAEWIGRRLEVSASVVLRRGADDGLWRR